MSPEQTEHAPCTDGVRAASSPRFTVAIVCFNAEEHIGEALASVAEQEFTDFELLVIDGASSDGTVAVVESWRERIGGALRLVSEPDDGLFHAMNKAVRLAEGEFLVFLGADDRLASGALRRVDEALLGRHVALVCGGTRVVGDGGGWTERAELVVRRGLPRSAPTRHQSIFVKTCALRDVGGFDTRYRIAADYDLYLRLWEGKASELLVPDVLSEFRLGGVSSRDAWATAREYRNIRIAHGASRLVESLVLYKAVLGVWLFALRHRTVGTPEPRGDSA